MLIVPTTKPEEIEQYSIRVVEQWKLGRGVVNGTRVDDGALLIIAKDDHRLRIEVGQGLEGALTDATSNRIISETITPAIPPGQFLRRHRGRPRPDDQGRSTASRCRRPNTSGAPGAMAPAPGVFPQLLFAVLIGSVVLRAIFGRTLGSAFTGLGAGFLVYLAGYALALAGLAAVAGFLFALLMGFAGGGSGWSSGPRGGLGGGWGGLGGGFGGGGFGGGGGGFSGGGRRLQWRRRLGQLVSAAWESVALLRHLFTTRWSTRRHFSAAVLDAIEQAIGECEGRHGGEIRFVVETRA